MEVQHKCIDCANFAPMGDTESVLQSNRSILRVIDIVTEGLEDGAKRRAKTFLSDVLTVDKFVLGNCPYYEGKIRSDSTCVEPERKIFIPRSS